MVSLQEFFNVFTQESFSGKKPEYTAKDISCSSSYFSFPEANSFQKFIIKERIHKFVAAKILQQLCLHSHFIQSYEQARIVEDIDEETKTTIVEIGPHFITKTYEGKETFHYIIQSLNLRSVDSSKALAKGSVRFTSEGSTELEAYLKGNHGSWRTLEEKGEALWCIDLPIIFGEDTIYYGKEYEKDIKGIITYFEKKLISFLVDKTEFGVPHETYIDFLKQWFSGLVCFKSIT